MSEKKVNVGYGYLSDNDESLKAKESGVFGLNQNAFLTKFELNTKAGKDNTDGDALDIIYQIKDKEYRNRVFPITKVFDKNGNEIDETHKDYETEITKLYNQLNGYITHIVKSVGVTEEALKNSLSKGVTGFDDFINKLVALLPANYNKKPVDLFLEYQWSIADGNDKTYLILPKNMKGGYFAVPALPGKWLPVKQEDGSLIYQNQNGDIHPITKDKSFMESPKANQQGVNDAKQALNNAISTGASQNIQPGNGNAKQSNW